MVARRIGHHHVELDLQGPFVPGRPDRVLDFNQGTGGRSAEQDPVACLFDVFRLHRIRIQPESRREY